MCILLDTFLISSSACNRGNDLSGEIHEEQSTSTSRFGSISLAVEVGIQLYGSSKCVLTSVHDDFVQPSNVLLCLSGPTRLLLSALDFVIILHRESGSTNRTTGENSYRSYFRTNRDAESIGHFDHSIAHTTICHASMLSRTCRLAVLSRLSPRP